MSTYMLISLTHVFHKGDPEGAEYDKAEKTRARYLREIQDGQQ